MTPDVGERRKLQQRLNIWVVVAISFGVAYLAAQVTLNLQMIRDIGRIDHALRHVQERLGIDEHGERVK